LVGEGSNLPNNPYSGDNILILVPFRTGGCSTNHFNIIMAFGSSKQVELCSLYLIVAVFYVGTAMNYSVQELS
jgi:hypothetical protein